MVLSYQTQTTVQICAYLGMENVVAVAIQIFNESPISTAKGLLGNDADGSGGMPPGRAGSNTWAMRPTETKDGKLDAVLITGFPAGMLACNCYVLAPRPGSDAIVVDPGQRAMGPLRRILDENRLTPAAVLLTHGHVDHIWSAQKVADIVRLPGLHPSRGPVHADRPDQGLRASRLGAGSLASARCSASPSRSSNWTRTATRSNSAASPSPSTTRPGHTRGRWSSGSPTDPSDVVFTGDTLFRQSVGRTDLPGGSGRDLLGSIVTKLLVLDDDTVVLPGHGTKTTIGVERRTNPFLEGLTREFQVTEARPSRRPRASPTTCRRTRRSSSPSVTACSTAARRAGYGDVELPDLRGHRAVRPRRGGVHRRGVQGDVHLRRPRRPLGDAAPGGHRGRDARGRSSTAWTAARCRSSSATPGPFFRYERPQAGRYRQLQQVGWRPSASTTPRWTPR